MDKVEKKRRQIDSELDRRKTKRRRDDDEFKVVEGVIDPPTLKILYKLLNRGTIKALHGAISTGKEANVYRGEDVEGNSVAVKIYRMSTAETDFMFEYIVGDPRFRNVRRKSRTLIPKWALKEYKNLKRYHEASVKVPAPIDIERNVLVMEFIGDHQTGLPAPLIRNIKIPSPVDIFNEIIEMIENSFTKAGLVHADLSEFNILWHDGPVFIDVSQAVLTGHDNAKRYLFRDIQNITQYFQKLDVETEDPEVITKHILSLCESE
ncbi:MAG: serine protein kinase RIO [Candidatus Thorarchaeota archaeon]|nr:MAG: serine protein kinase RIO [Candidatus Thorarchaeota archaeon]